MSSAKGRQTDLLKQFHLSRNPFVDRTAEKSELDEVSLYIHSDLQGFKPSGECHPTSQRTRPAWPATARSSGASVAFLWPRLPAWPAWPAGLNCNCAGVSDLLHSVQTQPTSSLVDVAAARPPSECRHVARQRQPALSAFVCCCLVFCIQSSISVLAHAAAIQALLTLGPPAAVCVQMQRAYQAYNDTARATGKTRGHFVIDLSRPGHLTGCLRQFQERVGASDDNWDALFSESWSSADMVDCMLSYAATHLVDEVTDVQSVEGMDMLERIRAGGWLGGWAGTQRREAGVVLVGGGDPGREECWPSFLCSHLACASLAWPSGWGLQSLHFGVTACVCICVSFQGPCLACNS